MIKNHDEGDFITFTIFHPMILEKRNADDARREQEVKVGAPHHKGYSGETPPYGDDDGDADDDGGDGDDDDGDYVLYLHLKVVHGQNETICMNNGHDH